MDGPEILARLGERFGAAFGETHAQLGDHTAVVDRAAIGDVLAFGRDDAALRAEHPSLRLPDAMSLATAIANDSTLLTLDKKLRRIARRVEPRSRP